MTRRHQVEALPSDENPGIGWPKQKKPIDELQVINCV
jgi:hypothetical protein